MDLDRDRVLEIVTQRPGDADVEFLISLIRRHEVFLDALGQGVTDVHDVWPLMTEDDRTAKMNEIYEFVQGVCIEVVTARLS